MTGCRRLRCIGQADRQSLSRVSVWIAGSSFSNSYTALQFTSSVFAGTVVVRLRRLHALLQYIRRRGASVKVT
jgi:hypothetical protein